MPSVMVRMADVVHVGLQIECDRVRRAYRAGQVEQWWASEDGPTLGEMVGHMLVARRGHRLRRQRHRRWLKIRGRLSPIP